MAEYTSGQVNFAGLGNGTDFNTLVEGLIETESYHVKRLEYWKATWEAKVEKFQELNTALSDLKSTLSDMDTMNEFLTKTVHTSDDDVLTATADADAYEGTHTVEINQLAQNKILTGSTGYSSTDASINASGAGRVFSYTYRGTTRSLDIPAGTSLMTLKNIINADASNPGVRASIVHDGSEYYLQIRGMDLGVEADLEIDAATTLQGFRAADFATTQENQNSQIKVDGWPSDGWVSNASNSVTDVIEGLTLNLKDAAPGEEMTVTVDTDTDGVMDNVRTFVDSVNEVRALIRELTEFDSNEETGSILTGNYGVEMVSQRLKDITADKGVGFDYYSVIGGAVTGDRYSALSQLGITTDADEASPTRGELVLDEDVLEAAMEEDMDAVARLFAADYIGESDTSDFSYYSFIKGVTDAGTYEVEINTGASGITSAYINGHKANVDGWLVTGAPGTDEAGLVVQLDNRSANSTFSGTVNLKIGKIGEMVNHLKELTSSETGTLKILEENYDDIIDNIEDKILDEESRLKRMERTLRNKFARLDATLGNYENIQASLNSQIVQLTNNS